MNRKLMYFLWGVYPLTKIVYVFVALNQNIAITNEFVNLHYIFGGIGLVLCIMSLLLASNIYTNKKLYENKIVKSFYYRDIQGMIKEEYIMFSLFTTALSLSETMSLFGLVSFIMTGNIIVFFIMISITLLVWSFNFPKLDKFNHFILNE